MIDSLRAIRLALQILAYRQFHHRHILVISLTRTVLVLFFPPFLYFILVWAFYAHIFFLLYQSKLWWCSADLSCSFMPFWDCTDRREQLPQPVMLQVGCPLSP